MRLTTFPTNKFIRAFLCWLPAILYMGLIFYLSGKPAPEPVRAVPIYFDIKLVHIVEYGVLCCLIMYAIENTARIPDGWRMAYSVMLTYIYGLTDELHQVFIPSRSAKLADTAANLIGSLIAIGVIWYIQRKITGQKRVKFPEKGDDK